MRLLQENEIDRNRKASRQLIRIQSELNSLGLAMRDILDQEEEYPFIAWRSQFDRIRENLEEAIRVEASLSTGRDPQQTAYVNSLFASFWQTSGRIFLLAETNEANARSEIRTMLQPQQEALHTVVARLLVSNHEEEQRGSEQVNQIYTGIERNAWLFLGISILVISAAGLTIIYSSRSMFRQLEILSRQQSELARQLITTQETTFRVISRDLHDEFGQILTAIGAMLRRAGRDSPSSEFTEQIQDLNEVVQSALDKTRSLSQSLQPVIVEEQGLGEAILWHISVFERQTGIRIQYNKPNVLPELDTSMAVHIFRIVQESLNNIAKHAQVTEAYLHLGVCPSGLLLTVEDHGKGISQSKKSGIGLVAMKERAELIGGVLAIQNRGDGGTIIQLTVPLNEGKDHE